jgi:hypothetical protein
MASTKIKGQNVYLTICFASMQSTTSKMGGKPRQWHEVGEAILQVVKVEPHG